MNRHKTTGRNSGQTILNYKVAKVAAILFQRQFAPGRELSGVAFFRAGSDFYHESDDALLVSHVQFSGLSIRREI